MTKMRTVAHDLYRYYHHWMDCYAEGYPIMSILVIEHLKASDLPLEWAKRLQARPEQTVTVHIETESSEPAKETPSFTTDDPAFGIWRDYHQTTDVTAFVRRLRAPRYQRDGSHNQG